MIPEGTKNKNSLIKVSLNKGKVCAPNKTKIPGCSIIKRSVRKAIEYVFPLPTPPELQIYRRDE